MFGLIRTVAFNSSVCAKLCLYKSLVLPVLEYGIPAWFPQTGIQEEALERVQRCSTRFILGQRFEEMSKSYTDRLCTLKWSSLSSRRNCLMISFVVKCLFNTIKCESVNRNISVNHRYDSALTFKHLFARTQSLHLNAINRFPRLWSALPVEFRNSAILTSLLSFLTPSLRRPCIHAIFFPTACRTACKHAFCFLRVRPEAVSTRHSWL